MSLPVACIALCTFFVTRLVLATYTGFTNVPLSLWPGVFLKGFIFDLAALAYLLPFFILCDVLVLRRESLQMRFRMVQTPLLVILCFILLFLGVSEFTFWIEFQTRFNFIALDYLIYTNEVLLNIWQSYPILKIVGGVAGLAWLSAWFISRKLKNRLFIPRSQVGRTWYLIGAFCLPVMSAALVPNDFLARQSNAFAEELSGNGLFTLASAARHNELDYDRFYPVIPQEKADKILKDLDVEWTDDTYRRTFDIKGDDATPHPLPSYLARRPKHIVLISVESLSAKFLGVFGSNKGLTPNLDRLAKEGLLFTKVFATGTRTVRGLEALSLSTPPIPGQAILRRPKNHKLASVGEMLRFQNYEAFFAYGGYGYFDNMSEFFGSNAYTVVDRTDIPEKSIVFENVWGVADEVLYNHTLSILDQATREKPVFAHVMTTSNHRPYTYPPNRIDIPSPGGRAGAVKYTDYAIGKFIEDARKKPWFKETIFVIVADHCASVAGKTELPVADYHIPLIFYGPGLVKSGRIDRMISQMDIPPTLFDMLGAMGDDNFFGKELPEQKGSPRAFISNYQNLGYYKDSQLIILKPRQQVRAYRIDPVTYEASPIPPDATLTDEAIAYYQTASHAFKQGKLTLLWRR